MACRSFQISRLPRLIFGEGELSRLPDEILAFGHRTLIVTGGTSFLKSGRWDELEEAFDTRGISFEQISVPDEPSPDVVDDAVSRFRGHGIDCVVGIGGGSPLDAAKAIAGLLISGNSVIDHLEGAGKGLPYSGPSTPFIAVPTTAG
ncbi:MAG: iron-containing alcohol dehydrogenase, partial [Verrucomicrobia bacterium]|nr:iron-containing alcohol dehydrogenase [Verrucomicrobiota bacterium]